MNKRLKLLRKDLNLSQKEFGSKIFLSQDHISSLENGRRVLTDRSIKDICSEFDVNEEWLRTGMGETYVDLTKDMDLPDHVRDMLKKILKLNSEKQDQMDKILDVFLSESKEEER